MRADVERNRDRILAAARALYATQGLTISMAAVAREAGVGKATLSRHFATRLQLIDAVFVDHMEAYALATEAALADRDPWRAFVEYIWTVCGMQAQDRGFADVLTVGMPPSADFERHRERAYLGFRKLINAAKDTGHLRSDFASEDLLLLLLGNAGVVAATEAAAPGTWRRFVGQVLRGYAQTTAPLAPLPIVHPSADLHDAMTRLAPTGILPAPTGSTSLDVQPSP